MKPLLLQVSPAQRLARVLTKKPVVVAGEVALVQEPPIKRGSLDRTGGGCGLQQGAADAVESLVAQVGSGAEAEEIAEEILHGAPG